MGVKQETMVIIVPIKCLNEKNGLDNTKLASELCYLWLVNFEEKKKTMVFIVPMRCLNEKPWSY